MKILLFLNLVLISFSGHAFSNKVKVALESDSVEGLGTISINELEFVEKDELGLNPLAYSLQFKKNKIAEHLLDRKIGINVRDYLGRSPLMIGVSNDMPIEFLAKFEEAKVDYSATDKNGRGADFYAEKSKKKEHVSSINELKKKFNALSLAEILELKQILKIGNHESLKSFFNKYRTINFKNGNEELITYLVDNNLISRWNIENLLGMGLNIFSSDFASQLVLSGNGNLLSSVYSYKLNFGLDSKGVPLIYHALKKNVSKEIILKIIEKSPNLNYEDSDGNNLLHTALVNKRDDLVSIFVDKKVSLNKLNNKKESALLLIAKNSSEEIIQIAFKEKNLNFDVKDANGNDPVIYLSKRYPQTFVQFQKKIANDGYDYSITNVSGEGAMSSTPSATIEDITSAINNLPDIKAKGKITNDLSTPMDDLEDLGHLEDKLKGQAIYSGDRVLDELILGAVEDHVADLKGKFINEYSHLASVETLEFKKKLDSVSRLINQYSAKILQLQNEKDIIVQGFDDLKKNLSGHDVQREMKGMKSSISGVVGNFEKLKNYVNDVNEDLADLSERKSELETQLQLLRSGKDLFSEEIKKNRIHITELKSIYTNKLRLKQIELDKNLDYLNSEVRFSNERLANSKADLDLILKNQLRTQEAHLRHTKALEVNEAAIESSAHRSIHVESEKNCPYVGPRNEAKRQLLNLNKEIAELNNKKITAEKNYYADKNEAEIKRDKLAKKKAVNEKEFANYNAILKNAHDSDSLLANKELARLEKVKTVNFKSIYLDVKTLKEITESKYGDVREIDKAWDQVYSITSKIKDLKDLEKILLCLPHTCIVNPAIKKVLEETKLGSEFVKVCNDLGADYAKYLSSAKSSNLYMGANENIDSSLKKVDQINKSLADLNNKLEVEISNKKLLSSELVEKSSKEKFDSLIRLQELFYLNSMQGKDAIIIKDEIVKVAASLEVKNLKLLQSYNLPLKMAAVEISFNDLNLSEVIIGAEIQQDSKAYVLQKWHALLAKMGESFGSLYTLKAKEIFVRSLMDAVRVYKVSDKDKFSIMLATDQKKIIISADGTPVIYENDAKTFFDFDLVSTGKVREEIIQTIALLKKTFKTDDLSLLKESYDLGLIIRVLKYADSINDVDQALELISITKMVLIPAATVIPYGQVLPLALGLPECILKLHKKYDLGIAGNNFQLYQTGLDCASDILDPFTKVSIANYAIVTKKIVASLIPKRSFRNVHIKRASLKFIEVLTGISIENLNEKYLLGFSPSLDKLEAKMRMSTQFQLAKVQSILPLDNGINLNVLGGVAQYESSVEAYSLPNGREIINACSMEKKLFLKEAIEVISKEGLVNVSGPRLININIRDRVYFFQETPCLYIR